MRALASALSPAQNGRSKSTKQCTYRPTSPLHQIQAMSPKMSNYSLVRKMKILYTIALSPRYLGPWLPSPLVGGISFLYERRAE